MPRGKPPSSQQVADFEDLVSRGVESGVAAQRVGLSPSWGSRHLKSRSGHGGWSGPVPVSHRDGVAADYSGWSPAELLEDFAAFRAVYLGHVSKPWMVEAAQVILAKLLSPDRELVAMNCPPGVGKSTLLQDIVCWLIVRDRRLRVLYGSDSQGNARKATARIKEYLEAQFPVFAHPALVELGQACEPTRVLSHDFGGFKPAQGEGMWQVGEFRVAFGDDRGASEKENTLTALGPDSAYIGNRFDLIIWDDLATDDNTRSAVANANLIDKWDGAMGEARLDPFKTGLLVVNGQRIGPNDLYRHCLDQWWEEEVDGEISKRRKYTHIMYPAHYDANCVGEHGKAARSWPYGCLLDADRLPWSGPTGLHQKRLNSPRKYASQYQQQEGSEEGALLDAAYIYGTTDSEGIARPGALNRQRVMGQVPTGWRQPLLSLVTVDPSGTNYWGIQWWLYEAKTQTRALMRQEFKKTTVETLLDYDGHRFFGTLDNLCIESMAAGVPITHIIVEHNAAQRYFLAGYKWVQDWRRVRGVAVMPHTTHKNKLDPNLGIQTLVEPYRSGRYDLPYGDVVSRVATDELAKQLSTLGGYDDLLMANWFFEFHLHRLTTPPRLPMLPRASWQRKKVGV